MSCMVLIGILWGIFFLMEKGILRSHPFGKCLVQLFRSYNKLKCIMGLQHGTIVYSHHSNYFLVNYYLRTTSWDKHYEKRSF